jgi:hypothetical protein
MKSFATALSGAARGGGESNLTNVQCKAIENYHNEFPLYNEYILIKMEEKNGRTFPNFGCKIWEPTIQHGGNSNNILQI